MEPIDKSIALEWYEYGNETGDDFFAAFMFHWIAFNWLYSKEPGSSERDQIRAFYEKYEQILNQYDPFADETGTISLFLQRPVYDVRTNSRNDRSNELFNNVKHHDALSLFLTLYQVRCNLFHGSKSVRDPRDNDLVRVSAIILHSYLATILG